MPQSNASKSASANRRTRGPSTPLYMQVVNELKAEIVRGAHPIGAQLPSESALVERFGVSRQTVRQALRMLREAGLVRSHQGLGTIVERPGLNYGYVHQIDTISDLFPADVETRYLRPEQGLARLPPEAFVFPGIPPDSRWLATRACRSKEQDAHSFNLMTAYIAEPFASIGRIIEDHRGSIYSLIENMFAESIDEVEQVITTFRADCDTAAKLGMKTGETGVEVRRKYMITSVGQIALISINRYAPGEFSFSMSLKKMRG